MCMSVSYSECIMLIITGQQSHFRPDPDPEDVPQPLLDGELRRSPGPLMHTQGLEIASWCGGSGNVTSPTRLPHVHTARGSFGLYAPYLTSQLSREASAFGSFASALLEHLSKVKAPRLTPVL